MAETNLIKKEDLARAREVEFVNIFGDATKKLLEAMKATQEVKPAKKPATDK